MYKEDEREGLDCKHLPLLVQYTKESIKITILSVFGENIGLSRCPDCYACPKSVSLHISFFYSHISIHIHVCVPNSFSCTCAMSSYCQNE